MPCPEGVQIPRIFGIYNDGFMYDRHSGSRYAYKQLPEDQQADKCIECRECEEKCPQHFDIPESLKTAHAWLNKK